VSSIDGRLRRLEEQDRGGCPECSGTAGYVVVYGTDTPPREKICPACGRSLVVFRVVYDGEEGEGA
jgi:RNA polymerase subunit RPABC4/transcription elongation factor Spt4